MKNDEFESYDEADDVMRDKINSQYREESMRDENKDLKRLQDHYVQSRKEEIAYKRIWARIFLLFLIASLLIFGGTAFLLWWIFGGA